MTGPPGRFLVANGLRQHYLDLGTGEPAVVICHKVTAGAETWAQKAAELATSRRVVVPDLRGHGYTDQPDGGYSLVDYGRDVVDLIQQLGLTRPALVGHSLGGRIALHVGSRHPEAVSRVVAIDPPLSGPGRPRYAYPLESFTQWRAAVVERGVAACLTSGSSYTRRDAELRARYGVLYSMTAVVESWYGFHLEDVHELIRRLGVPALLLYGDRGVVAAAEAAQASALSGHLTVRRIPDAGHNVPWDNWPAVRDAVRGFLGLPEGAGGPGDRQHDRADHGEVSR